MKRLIIDNMCVRPHLSLSANFSQLIFDELRDYLNNIEDDINRRTLVNDLFKIMTSASHDDNVTDIEPYVPYIIKGLLAFWSYPEVLDVYLNEQQLKILNILENKNN